MTARSSLVDFLPEMYRAMLPELFFEPVEEERHATCGHCAMLPPEEPLFPPEHYFSPGTRCCTYHPRLPNYAVGGLLADRTAEGTEGRRRVRERIDRRIGVTPVGIVPTQKHRLLYRHGRGGFGRSRALLCPYLDHERGQCTVWTHREAVCATWFCKHNEGQDGRSFWMEVRNYLLDVELVLSAHALRELGLDAETVTDSPPDDLELGGAVLDETPPDARTYERLWGAWAGREEAFYAAAHSLVRGLDRAQLSALGGIRLTLQLDRLAKRHEAIRHPVPDPLLRNPALQVRRGVDGSFILVGYTGSDAVRLQKHVYELLDYFDGRLLNEDVNRAIFRERALRISASLLTRLYRHRILVDPAEPRSRAI